MQTLGNLHIPWSDVLSMLGAPLGIAGIAAVNFALTALCLNSLPATASSVSLTVTHVGIATTGLVAAAPVVASTLGCGALLYFLYRRIRISA